MGNSSKEKTEKMEEDKSDNLISGKARNKRTGSKESSVGVDDSTSTSDVTLETPADEEPSNVEESEEESEEEVEEDLEVEVEKKAKKRNKKSKKKERLDEQEAGVSEEEEEEVDIEEQEEEPEGEEEAKKAKKRSKKSKKKDEADEGQGEDGEEDELEEEAEQIEGEEAGGEEDEKKARKRDKKNKKKERKKRYSCSGSDTDSVSSAGSYYYYNYDSDSSSLSSGSELSLLGENVTKKKFLKGVRKEASKASLLDSASVPNGSFRRYLTSDDEGDASSDDEISDIGLPAALSLDSSSGTALDTASAASARTAPPTLGAHRDRREENDKEKSKEKHKDKGKKSEKVEKREREHRKSLDEYFDQSNDTGRHRKLLRKHSLDLDDIMVPKRVSDSSKKKTPKKERGGNSDDVVNEERAPKKSNSDDAEEHSKANRRMPPRVSSKKLKTDGTLRSLIESETCKTNKKSEDVRASKKSDGQPRKNKNTEEEPLQDDGVTEKSKRHRDKKGTSTKSDSDDEDGDLDLDQEEPLHNNNKDKSKRHSKKEKGAKAASDYQSDDDAEDKSLDDAKEKPKKHSKKNKSTKDDDTFQEELLDDSKEKHRRHSKKEKAPKNSTDVGAIDDEHIDDKEKTRKHNKKEKIQTTSSDNVDVEEELAQDKEKSRKHSKNERSKSLSDDDDVADDPPDDKEKKKQNKKSKGVKYTSDDDSEAPKKRNKKDKSPEPETEEMFDWSSKQDKLEDYGLEEVYDWSKQKKKEKGVRDISDKDSSVASKRQSKKEKPSKSRDGPSDVPPKSLGPLDVPPKSMGPLDVPPKKKPKDKKERRPTTDDHIPVLLKLSEDSLPEEDDSEPALPAEENSLGSPIMPGRDKLLVDIIKQQSHLRPSRRSRVENFENSSAAEKSPKKSPKKKKKESGKQQTAPLSLPQIPVLSEADAAPSAGTQQRGVDAPEVKDGTRSEESVDEKLSKGDSGFISDGETESRNSEETDDRNYHIWHTLARILAGYSDVPMMALLDACPQIATMKFDTSSLPLDRVPAGSHELYLLSILSCIGASREVLSTCYGLYPTAINEVDDFFGTPLHCALTFGVPAAADRGTSTDLIFKILEYLIERDPRMLQSQHNSLSQSVLHTSVLALCASSASAETQLPVVANEVVSLLLDYHPSLAKLRDHQDLLPLHLAAKHTITTEILERILKVNGNACLLLCKVKGFTPLHYAAQAAAETARARHTAKLLNVENDNGTESEERQEFMLPTMQHHLSIIQALIQAGPLAAQVPDHDGHLPLHVALNACKPADIINNIDILHECPALFISILEILTKTYPDAANTPDNQGITPLEDAEERNACDSVINAISLI